jgi:hypothetical protein
MSRKREKKHNPLMVEPYDCNHRFLVWSESRPDVVHLVDLEENDGRYQCSCEDWEFQNDKYFLWQKPYECKHITYCKIFKAQLESIKNPKQA